MVSKSLLALVLACGALVARAGALVSINQYDVARALQKAGLDPRKDVQWIVGVPQPDLMKMLGQKQVDATDLAYQFGFFAQNNKWGPIVATGDEIEPNSSIAVYAARGEFVKGKRDVLVRFAMAYLQGVKEFNAAAMAPDQHPEVLEILAKNTFRNNEKTLAEAGCTLADLVTMTVFLIDARHTTRMTELRTEILGADFPASAAITVSGFADPAMMIEIQGVAVK